jgi:hypothetical protein
MIQFESRTGELTGNPRDVYDFVTDLRNLRQFLKSNSVDGFNIEKERCSFRFPAVGNVDLHLAEKEPFGKVLYSGTALTSNQFSLQLSISDKENGKSEIKVKLNADLNPFLKMVASEPIKRFLEELVNEMEKFRGWNKPNA